MYGTTAGLENPLEPSHECRCGDKCWLNTANTGDAKVPAIVAEFKKRAQRIANSPRQTSGKAPPSGKAPLSGKAPPSGKVPSHGKEPMVVQRTALWTHTPSVTANPTSVQGSRAELKPEDFALAVKTADIVLDSGASTHVGGDTIGQSDNSVEPTEIKIQTAGGPVLEQSNARKLHIGTTQLQLRTITALEDKILAGNSRYLKYQHAMAVLTGDEGVILRLDKSIFKCLKNSKLFQQSLFTRNDIYVFLADTIDAMPRMKKVQDYLQHHARHGHPSKEVMDKLYPA